MLPFQNITEVKFLVLLMTVNVCLFVKYATDQLISDVKFQARFLPKVSDEFIALYQNFMNFVLLVKVLLHRSVIPDFAARKSGRQG